MIGPRCDECDAPCTDPEDEFGEIICAECRDRANERAWERHCTDYEGPLPLIEQQIQARRLK